MQSLRETKNWSVEIEKEITEKWKNSELFNFNLETKKKIYSIDTPPPYINAPIHIGQAITYCFMDMFARFRRMKGYEVIFPLGLDRNGLPIEVGAEKKYKISAFDMKRKEFIEYCYKLLEETAGESIDSFSRLGISFSSYKEGDSVGAIYKTDSPSYRSLTQKTFIELFKRGLIYEDTRINNWDSKLRTTIADSEIEYKDVPSTFNYVKWKVKESGEEIVIGTTRPELICTCGMVIFNPDDDRFKHLDGKIAITPLFGKEVPIKAHPLAQTDKGTGIAMMCSAGDLSDIQFFREEGLKPEIAIDKEGRMNEKAGKFAGLKVKEARDKIIETLKEKNLLERQEKIIHRTPISERSGVEIEFIEMSEFYLKQLELKENIKKISNKMNFYPDFSKKILFSWIDSISIDWPISRRRFYATEIPLWYSEKDGEKLVAIPTEIGYYQPWKQSPPQTSEVYSNGERVGNFGDFENLDWIGEERVLDTWMDSSISELVILKYKRDDEFFKKAFPSSLRPQGKDIIRTWLYYTILRGYLETGKACFEDVWIHQHIVDANGNKMSKSKGNVIDPHMLLEKYGAEAIRLWASTEGDLSQQDFKCSENRIEGEKKTLNKLLNVSKFVMMFEKPQKIKLNSLDKLFVDYMENLTKRTEEFFSKYDFNHPAQELRQFLWDIFASNYIELVKSRAYNEEDKFTKEESASAKYTLHYLLERLILLLYPIIPQITSFISNEKGIDLIKSEWPKVKVSKSDLTKVSKIIEFNSFIWKTKKERGISLKGSIEGIDIPEELKEFEKDLKAAHNI
ncbi:MAG: valine--tRNA ligase [Candidatus Pacearchaeota archaeon]